MNTQEYVSEWLDLLKTRKDDEALMVYCEKIIPQIMPGLKNKFQENYGYLPKYDGLISLLGFTPDTVVLTYHFIQPQNIVILHTKETAFLLDVVLKYTHAPLSSFYHEPFDELPYSDIYRALDAAIKRFPKGSKIAIELTGGKKTMGGALAVAAGMLDIDLFYIDYSEYLPEYRKPKPESTYVHLVENPMRLSVDLFGSLEIEHAISFFNVGKFEVSKTLFEQVGQKMSTPRVAEFCTSLSEFYYSWNSFDFDNAEKLSTALFEQGIRFNEQILAKLRFDLNRLQKQIEAVKELAKSDRFYLMLNFYFTAQRYERNGQNDIASLLYYRTIESVLDNVLKDIAPDFDRSNPNYNIFGTDIAELKNSFLTYRKKVYKDSVRLDELPIVLALFDSLCLLGALSHPLSQTLNPGRIANIANVRNLSVYAHGNSPISQKSTGEIRNIAQNALQAYSDINKAYSVQDYQDKFEFMTLELR